MKHVGRCLLASMIVIGTAACSEDSAAPASSTAGTTAGAFAGSGAGASGIGGVSGIVATSGVEAAGTGSAGTGAGTTAGTGVTHDCVPDATRYTEEVLPILEQRCAKCHTTPTDFGAPFTLLDYDSVVAETGGSRIVDRMVEQLGAGTMPPAGNIRPTPTEHDVIVDWATCGVNPPPYPTTLVANRDIFTADTTPPSDATAIPITAQGFSVPNGTKDLYKNFTFSNLVTSDKFIRRIDTTIDKSRVVHHITLHYAGSKTSYLYAWAPGTGAVQFPSGGLRIKPSDQFRMEVHYNNVSGEGDAVDSSGLLLYVAEPTGTEYAMLDPNTFSIFVPAASAGQAQVNCTAQNDFTILAGMPHMHEIGDSYSHTLMRGDGSTESIIELSGWSFDLQFFYEMNVDVKAGDTMNITCKYFNDKDTFVIGGTGTGDEMCYDFIYVTPPTASLNCN